MDKIPEKQNSYENKITFLFERDEKVDLIFIIRKI